MIRIAVIGVGAAVLAVWVKGIKSEYAVWILLAAGVLTGGALIGKLEVVVSELEVLRRYFHAHGAYIKLLIKIIGITYLAEISADLCRDAGANSLASQIELFGKLSILVLCMPVMTSLLETIDYFLGG